MDADSGRWGRCIGLSASFPVSIARTWEETEDQLIIEVRSDRLYNVSIDLELDLAGGAVRVLELGSGL